MSFSVLEEYLKKGTIRMNIVLFIAGTAMHSKAKGTSNIQ